MPVKARRFVPCPALIILLFNSSVDTVNGVASEKVKREGYL